MRRCPVIALCALPFLVTLPAPAHAWWDWLEDYSGPGPFTGPTSCGASPASMIRWLNRGPALRHLPSRMGTFRNSFQDLHLPTPAIDLNTQATLSQLRADGTERHC